MDAWNPEIVKPGYEKRFKGHFQKHPHGRVSLNPNPIATIIQRYVSEEP